MKILHTSDWHIGERLNDYDRTEEFLDFFRQLEAILAEEKPDVMVVSGDIYDSGTPSNAAQKLYTDSLLHLHGLFPDLQVVIAAGNHDSGSRLEISAGLWGYFGIHIIGAPRYLSVEEGRIDLQHHIVEIKTRTGERKGFVAAVPYIYKPNFPDVGEGEASLREQRPQRFFQALSERIAAQNPDALPVVLMAHTAVSGGDFSCHETDNLHIGGEECMPASVFGDGFDYIALGHIHKAQPIPGTEGRVRYSGSVIPLNFNETFVHSLTVADLHSHGGKPEVRTIPLKTLIPVCTVPETPTELEEALWVLKAFPDDKPAYIRVPIKTADILPANTQARVMEALKGKRARFCFVKTVSVEMMRAGAEPLIFASEIREKSPVEMAGRYYREKYGQALEPEMEKLLENLWRETENLDEQ